MKIIRCGAVVPGCDYKAHGKTDADVLANAAEHARTVHGLNHISPELMAKIKGAIEERPDDAPAA